MQFVEAEFGSRDAEKTLKDRENELGETQEKWERETNAKPPPKPNEEGLLAVIPFENSLAVLGSPGAAEGKIVDAEKPEFSDGFLGKALKLDGKAYADFGPLAGFDRTNSFSYGAWVRIDGDGAIMSKMG